MKALLEKWIDSIRLSGVNNKRQMTTEFVLAKWKMPSMSTKIMRYM